MGYRWGWSTMTRGTARNVYLRTDNIETIRKVEEKYGEGFSFALRLIINEWTEYNELFGNIDHARRIVTVLDDNR